MCRSQISGSTKDHFAGEKRGLRDFADAQKGLRNHFASKVDFAALRSCLSASDICLPTAVTPSFQLRIVHRLKHWIADFLRFEMKYSMHKMDFRKCSKIG